MLKHFFYVLNSQYPNLNITSKEYKYEKLALLDKLISKTYERFCAVFLRHIYKTTSDFYAFYSIVKKKNK